MKALVAIFEPKGMAYIKVAHGDHGWTSDVLPAQVLLDYDIAGNVIGIEVLW